MNFNGFDGVTSLRRVVAKTHPRVSYLPLRYDDIIRLRDTSVCCFKIIMSQSHEGVSRTAYNQWKTKELLDIFYVCSLSPTVARTAVDYVIKNNFVRPTNTVVVFSFHP